MKAALIGTWVSGFLFALGLVCLGFWYGDGTCYYMTGTHSTALSCAAAIYGEYND